MTLDAPRETDRILKITREEASSPHVDDLLQRQQNLRGAAGLRREHRRRWYYSNWFIFMLAGGGGALAAGLLMEPFFDDHAYIQGRIESRARAGPFRDYLPDDVDATLLEVQEEQILVFADTKRLQPDGTVEPLSPDALTRGQEVGLYVDPIPIPDERYYGATLVRFDPPPHAPEAALSLDQQLARSQAAGLLILPLVAALIGLAIGAMDGLVCRVFRRMLVGGVVGLLAGFIGGFVSSVLATLVYTPLSNLAMQQTGTSAGALSTFGFVVQVTARGLAWCLAGMAMGLGQGLALRSRRLLLYGFLGGTVGGLLGGLVFDPIDILILGMDKPSAHVSRLIGFTLIGATVGAMIGIVELLARNAWLRMLEGPLAGKEFLIFRDTMNVGSSRRCDIYLFNDPDVAPQHAILRAVGENYELENVCRERHACVNGRPVDRCRLRHGDQITIGRTVFAFQSRQG